MAIYMCRFQVITRNEGRSAVAAAAYRSGEKIKNQWDGVEHDYTHKAGIVYKNIILPAYAPQEYSNRAKLWNAVELTEKSSDSRLCRECILALPKELSLDQQIKLVEEYVQINFVARGMCADIAIHNPVLTDDLHRPIDENGNPTNDPARYQYNNPHAHILLTMRSISKTTGRWEAKEQKLYLCKRGSEQQGFTASEFAQAKLEGWERQYKYIIGDKKQWMTPTEAEALRLTTKERVSRNPRSSPRARENPITADWNDRKRITEWRQSWADIVNKEFQRLGIDERIDARSYADRGVDRIAEVRKGPAANAMDKRGERLRREGVSDSKIVRSNAAAINDEITRYNQSAKTSYRIQQAAQAKAHTTASRLEQIRRQLIYNGCKESVVGKSLATAQQLAQQKETDVRELVNIIDVMVSLNEKAVAVIATLAKALESTSPLQRSRRREIQDQIDQERTKISQRSEYVKATMQQRGYSDEQAVRVATEMQAQVADSLRMQQAEVDSLAAETAQLEDEYAQTIGTVPELCQPALEQERSSIRCQQEIELQTELQHDLAEAFTTGTYQESSQVVDKRLTKAKTPETSLAPAKVPEHHGKTR